MEYLDTSVVVKWYKGGEEYREEALKLLSSALEGNTKYAASEWLSLEMIRGLVKNKTPKQEIKKACESLAAYFDNEAIQKITVTETIESAKELMMDLNLQAADAVHLATAIHTKSTTLWTEDEHFHKKTIKEYALKHGVEIKRLGGK